MRTKYCNDISYRLKKKSKVNEAQKRKYNGTFKSEKNQKVTNVKKVDNCGTTYRDKVKENIKTFRKHKYHHDVTFQQNVKKKMKERTKDMYNNPTFKQNFKAKMKKTRKHLYQNNPTFKQNFKAKMKKGFVPK